VIARDPVTVVDVRWHGNEAVELTFRQRDGVLGQRLLYRDDEPRLAIVVHGRAWSFDGDGVLFRLVSEAKRLELAHLFDPFLALSIATIEPLPHQVTAVYEDMLPRQPLRYLLADDPGAGKTIMTGLLIRELQVRGDLSRCLIVAPGSLVEQWRAELAEKFGLTFRALVTAGGTVKSRGNPFADHDLVIARLDKLARDSSLQEQLVETDWDLIVFDEAHKLSASLVGGEVKKTKRRLLAERARELTRNFLLLTATPHNGKEEEFELFLGLLDPDRFEAHSRRAGEAAPPSAGSGDLMRRVMKERLVRFDGTPLFPPRHAHVVPYDLTDAEAALYENVTTYVRVEMNRAERLKREGEGPRGTIVGFAMTVLQRRLASSPEAIYQSLRRRRERLIERLHEALTVRQAAAWRAQLAASAEIDAGSVEDVESDDATTGEAEALEERLAAVATAASTIDELRVEIASLDQLEHEADALRALGTDRKWSELAALMNDSSELRDASGSRRKLVIFTEHRDTLAYLVRRITTLVGQSSAVVTIHGGMPRELRRRNEASFKNDPDVAVLVATDAAGEGINLQRAHLMVNYDLPWNPNRIEQRFGRIHRIGQTEPCHLWNLVAENTREGDVYALLLRKMETESLALGGEVFDVLGNVEFGGRSLRELLIDAVRQDQRPEVRAAAKEAIDQAFDRDRLITLLRERGLGAEQLDQSKVRAVRDQMVLASVQGLQPHAVRSFFLDAFARLGGSVIEREPGRYEVVHVPDQLRLRARDRGRRLLLPRYQRIVFDKHLISTPGYPAAEYLTPGHPLLGATINVILERDALLLRNGAVLIDRADPRTSIRVLLYVRHAVTDARRTVDDKGTLVSEQLVFVELLEDHAWIAGPAPYLDYVAATEDERAYVRASIDDARWIVGAAVAERAVAFAASTVARSHLDDVRRRTEERVARIADAVRQRLVFEIAYWDRRADELELRERAGQTPALNSRRARSRAADLTDRLRRRLADLDDERDLAAHAPVVIGGAIVVPQGLLDALDGIVASGDTQRTLALERGALAAVIEQERAAGRLARDASVERLGYDIASKDPSSGAFRFIAVKAVRSAADPVWLTRSEVLASLNAGDMYWVACVPENDSGAGEPVFVRAPITAAPPFDEANLTFSIADGVTSR